MDIQRELTDAEREVVAQRLLAEQRERFDGVRKAAYTEAGVNPATWARATSGLRVRPDRLVTIVKSLWPASRGNWARVPEDPGSITPGSKYTGPTWVADADYPWVAAQVELKEYVDDAFADVDGRFGELEERVRELERIVLDFVEPEDAAQEELPVGVAARRGIRQRSITDVPQNEAGEENQDSGEMEPS